MIFALCSLLALLESQKEFVFPTKVFSIVYLGNGMNSLSFLMIFVVAKLPFPSSIPSLKFLPLSSVMYPSFSFLPSSCLLPFFFSMLSFNTKVFTLPFPFPFSFPSPLFLSLSLPLSLSLLFNAFIHYKGFYSPSSLLSSVPPLPPFPFPFFSMLSFNTKVFTLPFPPPFPFPFPFPFPSPLFLSLSLLRSFLCSFPLFLHPPLPSFLFFFFF